jgi:hypothetical protein
MVEQALIRTCEAGPLKIFKSIIDFLMALEIF